MSEVNLKLAINLSNISEDTPTSMFALIEEEENFSSIIDSFSSKCSSF